MLATDRASQQVKDLINADKLEVRTPKLTSLVNSLNRRLGKGESEAIALGIELQTDYIILDDFAARKEALRLGLNVKGTLAVIKKLWLEKKIAVDNLEQLYQDLMAIKFRVTRALFDEIFKD